MLGNQRGGKDKKGLGKQQVYANFPTNILILTFYGFLLLEIIPSLSTSKGYKDKEGNRHKYLKKSTQKCKDFLKWKIIIKSLSKESDVVL